MHGSRITKDRARALRRPMSLPEVLLWTALRGGKLGGLAFRKQHPLGPYILDFYCHAQRLAVEVDGEGHAGGDRPERDVRRDGWLRAQGIATLRLPARRVLRDVDDAIRTIEVFLAELGWDGGLQPPPVLRTTSP